MSTVPRSIEVTTSSIQQILAGVDSHIQAQQTLKLLDVYTLHHTAFLVNRLMRTFNTQPQTLENTNQDPQPPRPRVDTLATGEVKRDAAESKVNTSNNITANDWKRRGSTKRKGSIRSLDQTHRLNKTLTTGAIPLDMQKIRNQQRQQPIRKNQDPSKRAEEANTSKNAESKTARKQLEGFTFQFDGKVMPVQVYHPAMNVPKAHSKLSTMTVEAKSSKAVEVASIKTKKSIQRKPSKVYPDKLTSIEISSNIPLPVPQEKQKSLTFKDFSQNQGGKFKRISVSNSHNSSFSSWREVVQPQKQKVLDPKAAPKNIEQDRQFSRQGQFEKIRLILPKLKGKYNPVDGIASKIVTK